MGKASRGKAEVKEQVEKVWHLLSGGRRPADPDADPLPRTKEGIRAKIRSGELVVADARSTVVRIRRRDVWYEYRLGPDGHIQEKMIPPPAWSRPPAPGRSVLDRIRDGDTEGLIFMGSNAPGLEDGGPLRGSDDAPDDGPDDEDGDTFYDDWDRTVLGRDPDNWAVGFLEEPDQIDESRRENRL